MGLLSWEQRLSNVIQNPKKLAFNVANGVNELNTNYQ